MSDRFKKILLIVLLIIVLALAIWGFIFWRTKRVVTPEPITDKTFEQAILNTNAQVLPAGQSFLSAAGNAGEQSLLSVARNFAERYGSYSSDNPAENLKEIEILATAKETSNLRDEAKKLLAKTVQEFIGVSSRAVKVDLVELNEAKGEAKVTVSLQRQEVKTGAADYIYYQDLKLKLIQSGSDWLVEEAVWVNN